MATVNLAHIRKHYGTLEILHGLDLAIEDGEFLVLVGPSGCGKSTLLRVVAGLETITEGNVSIGERDVTLLPPRDRDIAMVFQNYALYPHMTVADNMAFGLKLRRIDKAEIASRVKRAATILDLSSLLDRYPRQLSGGQRQRVAMGRAIVRDPQVFLFGERPEHFVLSADDSGLPTKVAVVEPTGAETLVIGRVGEHTLQVLFKERRHFAPGDEIRLRPLPGTVHLFDAGDGKRLA